MVNNNLIDYTMLNKVDTLNLSASDSLYNWDTLVPVARHRRVHRTDCRTVC